jgi:DNA polymerase-3 subunit alpha
MNEVFAFVPEALSNTLEIADKVEFYSIDHDPVMSRFDLPAGFTDDNEYLRYLTYEGAKKVYPEMTGEIRERIDFELDVIKDMGFPGYFLVVQDFTSAARQMGVSVGPGRGSAAGRQSPIAWESPRWIPLSMIYCLSGF